MQKESPIRTGDNDVRLGTSSIQKFEGEDLEFIQRSRKQQGQMKEWGEMQMEEKLHRKDKNKKEEEDYVGFQRAVSAKMSYLEEEVKKAKRDQAMYDQEYNLALATEKRTMSEQQRRDEDQRELHDIVTQTNGVFLTENPDVFNISDGHKVRVDVFKGFTNDQNSEIRQIQNDQRVEKEANLQTQKREEQDWASREAHTLRLVTLMERKKERSDKSEARLIMTENLAKAEENRKR